MIRKELNRYKAAPKEGVRANYITTRLGLATGGNMWRSFMAAFCNHDISEIAVRYLTALNNPVMFLDTSYRLYGHVLRVDGRFITLGYLMETYGAPERLREIIYFQTPRENIHPGKPFQCPAMHPAGPTEMALDLIGIAHSLYRMDDPLIGGKFGKIAHLMAQSHQDAVLYLTVKGIFLTRHNGDYMTSVRNLLPKLDDPS